MSIVGKSNKFIFDFGFVKVSGFHYL
jgi:hypothetical protein